MRFPRLSLSLALLAALSGCQSSLFDGLSVSEPGRSGYRCGDGITLSVERSGASASASDSRGYNATMPASPPGQTTRYAEGIYALILEGSVATWFVSGQKPLECRR